ncbi:MAG: hypothetical protein ACLTW9_23355 [Enterocloster sp.]
MNRLLDAKTPEEREKVIGDTLEEFKKGAQAHLEQCEDTLNSHPCGEMSPEQIEEKEKRLQVLEEVAHTSSPGTAAGAGHGGGKAEPA